MVDPYDDDDRAPERLSGGDGPRINWTAAAVIVVLIAGAVLLARAAHHDSRRAAAGREHTLPPGPAPTLPANTPPLHLGTVFLEHLPECTRTDHRHRLSVALGVTNLGSKALVLLGATPLTSDAVLVQPVGERLLTGGCAGTSAKGPVRLAPGADAVVALSFRIGAGCPRHALVSAEVGFDGGHAGIVHADSSLLANLDRLDFVQCGGTTA